MQNAKKAQANGLEQRRKLTMKMFQVKVHIHLTMKLFPFDINIIIFIFRVLQPRALQVIRKGLK